MSARFALHTLIWISALFVASVWALHFFSLEEIRGYLGASWLAAIFVVFFGITNLPGGFLARKYDAEKEHAAKLGEVRTLVAKTGYAYNRILEYRSQVARQAEGRNMKYLRLPPVDAMISFIEPPSPAEMAFLLRDGHSGLATQIEKRLYLFEHAKRAIAAHADFWKNVAMPKLEAYAKAQHRPVDLGSDVFEFGTEIADPAYQHFLKVKDTTWAIVCNVDSMREWLTAELSERYPGYDFHEAWPATEILYLGMDPLDIH